MKERKRKRKRKVKLSKKKRKEVSFLEKSYLHVFAVPILPRVRFHSLPLRLPFSRFHSLLFVSFFLLGFSSPPPPLPAHTFLTTVRLSYKCKRFCLSIRFRYWFATKGNEITGKRQIKALVCI